MIQRHHPGRWRLNRAGMSNVWFYYDNEFACSGGRLVLRGTNGSGKSRALELLLPFLLDADRRRVDATGSARVRLEDLMRSGGDAQANRLGYLWLELAADGDAGAEGEAGAESDADGGAGAGAAGEAGRYLTLGALLRYSRSASALKVWYFVTPHRVGHDLQLMDGERAPLSRDALAQTIGADRLTESASAHRDRVRAAVFGLTGEAGRERYDGLLQLLHTLRSPDVGNRIDEGKLPTLLSEALPPLAEAALTSAGDQLDGLTETRDAQARLVASAERVGTFLGVYRRYAAGLLDATATQSQEAVSDVRRATRELGRRHRQHTDLVSEQSANQRTGVQLRDLAEELRATAQGIRESKAYTDASDLHERRSTVESLAAAADRSLDAAGQARRVETDAAAGADRQARAGADAVRALTAVLAELGRLLGQAGLDGHGLPAVTMSLDTPPPIEDTIRPARLTDPASLTRPTPLTVRTVPADLVTVEQRIGEAGLAAGQRDRAAVGRLDPARRLADEEREVSAAEVQSEQAELDASELATEAVAAEDGRDDTARALADAWRAWTADPEVTEQLGAVDWSATIVGPLLRSRECLIGDADPDAGPEPDSAVSPGPDAGPGLDAGTGAGPGTGAAGIRDSRGGLAHLDQAAAEGAAASRAAIADGLAELRRLDAESAILRRALTDEQQDLQAARDPEPVAPAWVSPASAADGAGIPLWRAVDFAEALPDEREQAGLEAALAASMLLTAALTADGRLVAATGDLLASPLGPPAAHPLSAALVVDPAAPVPAEVVRAVLARVGLGDRAHPVWVSTDGAWANGPLRGAAPVTTARYIGAAALSLIHI